MLNKALLQSTKKSNKVQQYQIFIIPYVFEA